MPPVTLPNDDDVKDKPYDMKLLKRLMRYMRPYRWHLVTVLSLNVVVSALGPLRPWLVQIAIDDHVAHGDMPGLMRMIAILGGTMVGQAVLLYILTYLMRFVGQHILYTLRLEVFQHASRLPLKYFDKTPVGRVVTRVTNDIDTLDDMFSSGIVMIMTDVMVIGCILAFMFKMDWRMALLSLTIVPPLLIVSFLFRIKARTAFRDVRKHLARLNSFMQERVTGMAIVQLFGRERDELAQFGGINEDHTEANIRTIRYYAFYFPTVEFLSTLVITLILWYAGGQLLQGALSVGVLFAFVQWTEQFFRPIFDLSDKYNVLQNALASSERIFELLDTESGITDPAEPKVISGQGAVDFENVWFSYGDNEEWVLRDLSLHIEPGQTVAIVGATGAGKTTIISLLNRFYDVQKGTIRVDGHDLREYRVADLRHQIAIVLQDVYLFPGTVKANISLENDEIPEERIIAAAKMVGADRFIDKLPDGYDSMLLEGGSSLSVGQKQLLSFARALAYDPRILILDEATSSVDTETEQQIQTAIAEMLHGRTAIVIAHRLSTIQTADRIIVMHKGEVREHGTHAELLAADGIYSRLYQLQYKDQEAKA